MIKSVHALSFPPCACISVKFGVCLVWTLLEQPPGFIALPKPPPLFPQSQHTQFPLISPSAPPLRHHANSFQGSCLRMQVRKRGQGRKGRQNVHCGALGARYDCLLVSAGSREVCVFITAVSITKLFAWGEGAEWRTCATRD